MKKTIAVLLVALSAMVGCKEDYKQVRLAPAVIQVSAQWTEIRPEPPLRWTEPEQEFLFHIDSPHQVTLSLEIVGPDGKRSVPDVQLVTNDGRTLIMDSHGFWGDDMTFSRRTPAPNITITAIRIRNDFPIRISNLIWNGYDPAKVKR